jgi:hypothetical protein
MTKHLYLVIAAVLFSTLAVSAQHGKILNKDFAIDSYNSVEFDLFGETHFEQWEADYILVETTVKVWDTPKQVFTNYINKGRYYCELKSSNDVAKVRSVPVERGSLSARESVVSVVYYPNSFVMNGSKIVRQEPVLSLKEEEKK